MEWSPLLGGRTVLLLAPPGGRPSARPRLEVWRLGAGRWGWALVASDGRVHPSWRAHPTVEAARSAALAAVLERAGGRRPSGLPEGAARRGDG